MSIWRVKRHRLQGTGRGAAVGLAALLLLTCLLFGVALLHAAEKRTGPYWPTFNGPNRDNISPETGLLKKWPEGGPKLIWTYAECGEGFASVNLADGMLFTSGDFDDGEMVIALDMEGKLLWKSPNGESWTGPYPGSRATPTYDEGMLYHLSAMGRLAAYRAKTGKEKWAVELKAKYGARRSTWAFAENVIVDGEKVFCVTGGSKALMVALDKDNGKLSWVNSEMDEKPAYCSPILAKYKTTRQYITLTQKSVIGVDIKKGKLLWSHSFPTPMGQNVTTPIYRDGHVFVSGSHAQGGKLLKMGSGRNPISEVWSDADLDNCHGGVILLGDRLYGSGCNAGGKAFFCVDFMSGKVIRRDESIPKLSITCAEGMIYGLSEKGKMMLLSPTDGGFEVVSTFTLPDKQDAPSFAHPVVCGGRLYLRDGKNLHVYDVHDEEKQ